MYNRSDRPARDIPIMTAASCVLCGIIFLAINMNSSQGWAGVARWGLLPEDAIYKGAWWALISSAFVHQEPIHLLFNLSWLWTLGGALERSIGWWRWLLFVFVAAFVSSGLQLLTGNNGIGMSGVVYAMFGFAWLTRKRFPEFIPITSKQNVQIMIGWAILCVFLTYINVWNIGNGAHFGGLFFGAAVGAAVDNSKLRIPMIAIAAALLAAAIVPLKWNPLSERWNGYKAEQAFNSKNWVEAARYYRVALDRGGDPAWAWGNLTRAYALAGDRSHFEEALRHLKQVDPADAAKFDGYRLGE